MARGPIKHKDPEALDEIEELTRIMSTFKANAEREFRKNLALDMERNELRRARLVRRAVEAGDTKAEIARRLGTTARIKVYELLEMTENLTSVPTNEPRFTRTSRTTLNVDLNEVDMSEFGISEPVTDEFTFTLTRSGVTDQDEWYADQATHVAMKVEDALADAWKDKVPQ